MRIATWNVNSVRARLPHVLRWLATAEVDALCLQETKIADAQFPHDDFRAAGYACAAHGQKAYNGVAIVSRTPPEAVACGMPERPDDPQARVIAATIRTGGSDGTGGSGSETARVISAYVPNGQSPDSDKYAYKLGWLGDFRDRLAAERSAHGLVAAGGDYNIAPADADIYDPEAWGDGILATPRERAAFRELLAAGYADAFRMFERDAGMFSWWDYRKAAYLRNMGLRIDHFLLSEELAGRATGCAIDRTPREWQRPSDHAPVVVEFDAGTEQGGG